MNLSAHFSASSAPRRLHLILEGRHLFTFRRPHVSSSNFSPESTCTDAEIIVNYLIPTLGLLAVPLFAAVFVAGWIYLFGPRVIRLLINKYLRKRRIAWVSLIAVMLCTAMVIVVISVMGGWLRMFRDSFHGLSGDIIETNRET